MSTYTTLWTQTHAQTLIFKKNTYILTPNPNPPPISQILTHPHDSNPDPPNPNSYVFSSRRYVVLANGALTCYNSKEERGGEPRDQLVLTPETQVVEMKAKGA